jgi:ABC-type Mn2+/Zn2+ transport system ATPase subunit
MSTKSPKIRLIDVSVGYLTETIIKNLSLEICKGELVGIFGPNGAGKTTLLCAINGLARIPEGKVLIDGTEFSPFNENSFRREIGYVPQHFEIDPKLPVMAEEVIMMGRYGKIGLFHFAGEKEKKLLENLSGMLEIEHILKKPFGQLSGGEKKRVLIARALIKEPEIMLLDEMFAWLDWKMVEKFTGVIKEIHKKDELTTLIVSHDIKIIENICQRIIWMDEGRIVFDGSRDEFSERVKEDGLN